MKGLLADAEDVPIGHRGDLLNPIMDKLTAVASLADRTAEYYDGSKAKQLKALAVAARKSVDDIRLVIEGA